MNNEQISNFSNKKIMLFGMKGKKWFVNCQFLFSDEAYTECN